MRSSGRCCSWLTAWPRATARTSESIVVSRGKIEQLATSFAKTWQRPPTDTELKGLIDDWVREEIAVREATAMGLDRDDTVVRRRLRQKLEFLSEDVAAQVAPSEDDLKAYLAAHPEKFQLEQRYTFRHVYLNPQRHSTDLQAKLDSVREALGRLGMDGDFVSLGDPFLLDSEFVTLPSSEVEKQFGSTFAAALERLAPDKWDGPVQSGYGLHFVQLQERRRSSSRPCRGQRRRPPGVGQRPPTESHGDVLHYDAEALRRADRARYPGTGERGWAMIRLLAVILALLVPAAGRAARTRIARLTWN